MTIKTRKQTQTEGSEPMNQLNSEVIAFKHPTTHRSPKFQRKVECISLHKCKHTL